MAGDAASAAAHRPPEGEGSPLTHVPSWVRFLGVGTAGLALDLWSKQWAFATLGLGTREPMVLIPHVLEFQTMLNPGALFGIGNGRTTLFLIASVFALVLVGWMFTHTQRRKWLLQIALGGILAGALGNMYDRVNVRLIRTDRGAYMQQVEQTPTGTVFQAFPLAEGGARMTLDPPPETIGYVRDFIKIPTKIFGQQDLWPWVFNVADMLLVGGVAILAIHLWRDRPPEPEPVAQSADPPADAPPPASESGATE